MFDNDLTTSVKLVTSTNNGYLQTKIKDTITCGDKLNGTTTTHNSSRFYLVNIHEDSIYIAISSSKSLTNSDTNLYLYDQNMTKLHAFNGDNSHSNEHATHLIYGPLLGVDYFVEFSVSNGGYMIELSCYPETCM